MLAVGVPVTASAPPAPLPRVTSAVAAAAATPVPDRPAKPALPAPVNPTRPPLAPSAVAAAAPSPSAAVAPGSAAKGAGASEVQLTQRVLADLQRQVELMLEVRLREALAPILARASDALVRDAKKELTAAMRDIVSRSIARELGRREER